MWVVPEYNRQALMPKKKEQYQRRREFRRTVCLAYVHTLPPPPLKEYLETFGTRKLLGSHVSFAHLPVG